jgi:hypothetical protein
MGESGHAAVPTSTLIAQRQLITAYAYIRLSSWAPVHPTGAAGHQQEHNAEEKRKGKKKRKPNLGCCELFVFFLLGSFLDGVPDRASNPGGYRTAHQTRAYSVDLSHFSASITVHDGAVLTAFPGAEASRTRAFRS